jgi:hypothetical protein
VDYCDFYVNIRNGFGLNVVFLKKSLSTFFIGLDIEDLKSMGYTLLLFPYYFLNWEKTVYNLF